MIRRIFVEKRKAVSNLTDNRGAGGVNSVDWKKIMTEKYRQFFIEKSFQSDNVGDNQASLGNASKSLNDSIKAIMADDGHVYGGDSGSQKLIKEFIESYNDTVDGLKTTSNLSAMQAGSAMISTTDAYSSKLENIGISVGADNKLSVNEEKLSNATKQEVDDLFSGRYSYGKKIADKASTIENNAQTSSTNYYDIRGNNKNSSDPSPFSKLSVNF